MGGMRRCTILVHVLRNHQAHFEDDAVGICAGLWNFALSYSGTTLSSENGYGFVVVEFLLDKRPLYLSLSIILSVRRAVEREGSALHHVKLPWSRMVLTGIKGVHEVSATVFCEAKE